MFSEINRSSENESTPKQTEPEQESTERRGVVVAINQTRDSAHVSTSAPKQITLIDDKCPSYLRYPTFTHPKECFNHNMFLLDESVMIRTVLPYRSLRKHPKPNPYILETGVVFYVYTGNRCERSNKYLIQVLSNARAIKEKDPSVRCQFNQSFVVEYCIDYQL